jgi:hypothetical protein
MDDNKKMESELKLLKELIENIDTEIAYKNQQIESYIKKNEDTHGVIYIYYKKLINNLNEEIKKLEQIKKNFINSAKIKYHKTDGKRKSKRKSKRRLFK